MRVSLLALVSAISLAAASPIAAATPSLSSSNPRLPSISNLLPAAQAAKKCPEGQHWVAGGYAKHGKYRQGRCAPN